MSEDANTLITVIMPVRDNEKLFPNAVKSVLNQTFQDWELIIVEGRSSDSTPQLADEFATSDKRIRTIHIDEWMYESTNIGIHEARGRYITVLNSDDLLMPEAIQTAAEVIYAYDVDVFLFAVANAECDEHQNVIESDAESTIARMPKEFIIKDREELKRNWINLLFSGLLNNQLNVYKKELVEDSRFRNDIFAADYFFNLSLLPKISSIAYIPRISYQFNSYITEGKLNASLGKYYVYQHRMFNDFYYKGIEVFATQEVLTKSALKFLRNRRMVDFLHELESYTYDQCELSLEERLYEIFSYAWDVKDIFEAESACDVLEDGVINTSYELIRIFPDYNGGKMQAVLEGCRALKEGTSDISSVNQKVIDSMIYDYYNPGHIGVGIFRK